MAIVRIQVKPYFLCQSSIIINYNMLEIMNEHLQVSSVSRQNQSKQSERGLKLPKIDKLPPKSAQREVKSSTKLPNIKHDSHNQAAQPNTEREAPSDSDFVGQVQRKIKMVIEEQHIVQLEESEESDEDAFERKIIQNKEIIKQAKRRNQKMKKENEHMNNNLKAHPGLNRKISHNNKNEIYEKRMRQYKQGSAENNYLQKKKDLVANAHKNAQKEGNELKEAKNMNVALRQFVSNKEISLRQVKSKGQLVPINKILPNVSNKNEGPVEPRKLNKQLSQKVFSPIQKNEQLFDAIHNYLENPKKHDIEAVNPLKIGKQRAELQKKLKWYEQKLTLSVCQDKQMLGLKHKISINSQQGETSNKSEIKLVTSSNWHKIGVSQRGILGQQSSSFDKQVDRINHYLQKNEQSLEKYVQNQKILLDVQLASRRRSSKDKHRTDVKSQNQ